MTISIPQMVKHHHLLNLGWSQEINGTQVKVTISEVTCSWSQNITQTDACKNRLILFTISTYYLIYIILFLLLSSPFDNIPGDKEDKEAEHYEIEHDFVVTFFSQCRQSAHCG